MKAANLFSALVILIWLGLAFTGRSDLKPFLTDAVPDWPRMRSIDFAITLPILMATALSIFAWICNASGTRPSILALGSFAALASLAPYLVIFGGGI